MKRQTTSGDNAPAEVEAQPAPKRQRVSRACDQCRAAREKCDGIQPLCFPCASQNRTCSWEEPKKKRGVQTGYIRTLELSLGWIFDKIPGSEEALHGLLTHEGGQGRALLVGKDMAAGNRLHRRWRKSIVHQEIDRVLSGGGTSNSKTDKTSPAIDEYDSSGDDPEHSVKEEISVTQGAPTSIRDTEPIKATHPSQPSLHKRDVSMTSGLDTSLLDAGADLRATPCNFAAHQAQQKTVLSSIKLPPNSWRLLDVYFSYTHCWFPILEKGLIHKACWSYPGEGIKLSDEATPRHGSHAELWAALAVAAYQDEASHSDNGQGDFEGQMTPEEIYRAARQLIPSDGGRFDTRHVNAILLLALVDIGRREYTAAWILIGTATRIALALNLPSRTGIDGSRRPYHTYMACFILDSLVSTQISQPPHLRANDVSQSVPTGEDDQDEWDIWTPCHGFGPARPLGSSSRSPAHSMSSFATFFGIHRIHCGLLFDRNPAAGHKEPYLAQVQTIVGGNPARHSFANFITNGGMPPYQVPSIHLLRLAFLSCGSQTQVYTESLPSTVLQCVEEHVLSFGSAIPPLFAIYMDLLTSQYNPELLKGDTRDRWDKAQAAIDSVWTPHPPQAESSIIHKPPDGIAAYMRQPHSNILYAGASAIPSLNQQLSTPSPHFAEMPVDQATPMLAPEVYHGTSLSTMMSFPTATRPPQTMNLMNHANSGVPGTTQYDLADLSPQHFPPHGRPSFSSTTFDYDSILDDIASLDRADRMGSDPQFMANLGFAPGSDLTELLSHDFTGLS